nr:MAG TPA: DNA polymerase III subunit alpha [Caudoviricetes sp.]
MARKKSVSPEEKQRQFSQLMNKLVKHGVILDIETTGLLNDPYAEIVEIAVIDMQGNVLLDTLVKPRHAIDENGKAFQVNGITNEMVKNARHWEAVCGDLMEILWGQEKIALAYNAKFDITMIERQSAAKLENECLMQLYSQWYGTSKRHKLCDAAAHFGITTTQTHRAVDDCQMALAVFNKMRQFPMQDDWLDDAHKTPSRYADKHTQTVANPLGHLYGHTVVITGDLSISRAEMQQRAADAGCRCTGSVSGKTTILVLGAPNYDEIKSTISQKEQKARELIAQGKPIKIMSEAEFIQLLNNSKT